MRIAVTGIEGQVARSLAERAAFSEGIELVRLGRPELDLCDRASVSRSIAKARPDLVVSAAAYTAVDRAEDEPDLAMAVNAAGAGAVARAARDAGAPVIHLSTDYVFAGDADRSYRETDATGPITVYGRSKLAGEEGIATENPDHIILRTAWVYSPFGHNFVRTMLRLAAARDEISVVSDQVGNPTSALDIADAILHLSRLLSSGRAPSGIYHLAGTDETSWSGFAEHIFSISGDVGGPSSRVIPISSADYPAKARRPSNSRLDTSKFADAFGWRAPDWRISSAAVVRRLFSEV